MKTFYSILYCSTRPNAGERVSIGLVLGNEKTCKFLFSSDKIAHIKGLVSDDALDLIKICLRSFENQVQEYNNDPTSSFIGKSVFSFSYFNYLFKYSNNLITYSEPKEIDVEVNQMVFEKLFVNFVYDLPVTQVITVKPLEIVKRRLTASISNNVNFNIEVTSQDIAELEFPSKVWFIGKNEINVTGEVKDFGIQHNLLLQQLNSHLLLINKIKSNDNGRGKFFIIGDEPSKKISKNHQLWLTCKNMPSLELVSTNEVGKIEDYMIEHSVSPLVRH